MKTKVVKERREPSFELICDSYMKKGYRMVSAGFNDSWWAILVLGSGNDDCP